MPVKIPKQRFCRNLLQNFRNWQLSIETIKRKMKLGVLEKKILKIVRILSSFFAFLAKHRCNAKTERKLF